MAYAIIIFVGVIWDHIAIYRGHWSFGKKFLLGPHIGLMPIEEFSFGIIMPYFGLVIYKIAEKYLSWNHQEFFRIMRMKIVKK